MGRVNVMKVKSVIKRYGRILTKQRKRNDLYEMSHNVTIRAVFQSFAEMFPCEPHDADAILRR